MEAVLQRRRWVFDLDGTLTVAMHDFQSIKAELGLPLSEPILESLQTLEEPKRQSLEVRLAAIEREVAERSKPAPGAVELLDRLRAADVEVGILTRNTKGNALLTLEAVGLIDRFSEAGVLGRDEAAPKPSPDGILAHLERWGAPKTDAVMVGDFAFDLQAGRGAGVATIYVDPEGGFPYRAWADLSVRSLEELIPGCDS